MGEAKKRTALLTAWESGLSDEERIVARVAKQTYARFVVPSGRTGMCYRMAFFLSTYLLREHSIIAGPIVGYVHDGLDDMMSSHAWIEFNGKKTDISLSITEAPSRQRQGQLIVLDQVLREGHLYTYHREQNDAALAAIKAIDPRYAHVVVMKNREHETMCDTARDPAKMFAYLNAAPDGLDYARLARISGLST